MRNKRFTLTREQVALLAQIRGKEVNNFAFKNGNVRIRLNPKEQKALKLEEFRNSSSKTVAISENVSNEELKKLCDLYSKEEIGVMIEHRENIKPIELLDIEIPPSDKDRNVGILLMSDWHADETVRASTVLNKNEYNSDIASKRIKMFFANTVKMLKKRPVDELIIGCLGDLIGGWIHEELAQTNSMTPMEGSLFVKTHIVSGLKLISDNLPDLERITFVGICGNHSRTTKKMQFANGYALSYEYFMYKDIEATCAVMGLNNIIFDIPQSEFAYIQCMGRKLLFAHGHQFKYAGGVGGIYPSMLRWYSKLNQTIKIDKAFIGHWHTIINIKEVVVNGTIKGFDAYAMGKGLPYEEPQQTFLILNDKRGFILHTPIFCD